MNDTCSGSCLTAFNSEITQLSSYVVNAFQTFILLIGYLGECYPNIFTAVSILASLQLILTFLGTVLFVRLALTNPNRLELIKTSPANVNVLPWWKDQIFPFLVNVWIFWVSAIYLAFNYAWISSVSTTLILLHVWCEFPILLILIVLIRDQEITWKHTIQMMIGILGGFLLNLILLAMTANPYIQGVLDILALVADFGNPIAFLVFLHYNFYQLTHKEKIRFVMTTIIFWNHIFAFYLPAVLCVYPDVVAGFYVGFLAISLIENLVLVIFEIVSWENLPIPTLL